MAIQKIQIFGKSFNLFCQTNRLKVSEFCKLRLTIELILLPKKFAYYLNSYYVNITSSDVSTTDSELPQDNL